jgi:hypothetical protein
MNGRITGDGPGHMRELRPGAPGEGISSSRRNSSLRCPRVAEAWSRLACRTLGSRPLAPCGRDDVLSCRRSRKRAQSSQPTTGAGGRHEMGVSLPIVGPRPGHPESVPEAGLALDPRVAARPRTTSCPGHPRHSAAPCMFAEPRATVLKPGGFRGKGSQEPRISTQSLRGEEHHHSGQPLSGAMELCPLQRPRIPAGSHLAVGASSSIDQVSRLPRAWA